MDIVNLVKSLIGQQPKDDFGEELQAKMRETPDHIAGGFVPHRFFEDEAYKDSRGMIDREELEALFEESAKAVGYMAEEVFSNGFLYEARTHKMSHDTPLVTVGKSEGSTTLVRYDLELIRCLGADARGGDIYTAAATELRIEQKTLDFHTAGKFINLLLGTHTLQAFGDGGPHVSFTSWGNYIREDMDSVQSLNGHELIEYLGTQADCTDSLREKTQKLIALGPLHMTHKWEKVDYSTGE